MRAQSVPSPRVLTAITFDCYGTLVDWETGIRAHIAPILQKSRGTHYDGRPVITPDAWIAEWEARQFALLTPWRPYREILWQSFGDTMRHFLLESFADDGPAFVRSLASWPLFADVRPNLRRLAKRYRLGIVSNIDDDLLADSVGQMAAPWSTLITAEQVQAYKPSTKPFERALERLGVAPAQVLHVAFGDKYDLAPARTVGMKTAWLRRHDAPPPQHNPDFTFESLPALCDHLLALE